jgi:hypothetical protein
MSNSFPVQEGLVDISDFGDLPLQDTHAGTDTSRNATKNAVVFIVSSISGSQPKRRLYTILSLHAWMRSCQEKIVPSVLGWVLAVSESASQKPLFRREAAF